MTAKRGPIPRQGILDIAPYVPGTSALPGAHPVIKLSSNESPFGPSPRAVEAFIEAASSLSRYPDGSARALREAIGKLYGLDPDHIVCGAGSDEVLNLIATAYLGPGDEAIYSEHGFLVYKIAILARGAKPVVAPETDLTTDVDAILARVSPQTRVVFIANPNNPTGTYLPFDEVKRLRAGLRDDVLLVLDAAYAEYVRANDYEAGIELVATTHNTVMTRTFSKIYGLAYLRLGWAYCPTPVADALNRIRGPFNVSGPAIAAGVAALQDQAWIQRSANHNDFWRSRMAEALSALGLRVTPSAANFLLLHFPKGNGHSAEEADKFLHGQRIILRRVTEYGFPNALRMTIGTEDDNRAVLEALAAFMGSQRLGPGMTKPLFDTLAIIGPGLIGSSIMRAARAQGAVRTIVASARSPETRKRVVELGIADKVTETNEEAVEGADLVIVCVPVGVCGGVAEGNRPASHTRRHRVGRGLGEGLDRARHGPASAEDRPFRAGPSGGRHRAFRPRCGLRRAVRGSLVHPDAARRDRPARPWRSSHRSGVCLAPMSRL